MKKLFSVFNLETLLRKAPDEAKRKVLIVTSVRCPWCTKLEPTWLEMEKELSELYEFYEVKVEEIGGHRVFMDGYQYFFQRPSPPIGYPTIFIIDDYFDIRYVPPPIFWDKELQQFKEEELLAHFKTEATK